LIFQPVQYAHKPTTVQEIIAKERQFAAEERFASLEKGSREIHGQGEEQQLSRRQSRDSAFQ
jgi:hypothetical protein